MNHKGTTKNYLSQLSFLVASVSLVFLMAAPGGFAQTKSSTSTAKRPAVNKSTSAPSDATFAMDAARGDLAEIKLGQLAEKKGATTQVKDFGKQMVTDHTKLNDDLKTVASSEKIKLPDKMNAQDQATYDQLSKLSGTAFDQAYAKDMVNDHKTDIDAFKKEANGGRNASVKGFASQSLPTLQEHLKLAQQMNSTSSSATTSSKNTRHS